MYKVSSPNIPIPVQLWLIKQLLSYSAFQVYWGNVYDLQIIPSRNYHQCLTWNPPSTLNITAVEPDICSYIVCSNISTECTTIDVTVAGSNSSDLRKHVFPNLRAYINFTVTAVNIVGDGESANIVYDPCEHTERLPGMYA